ncbi:MAG: chromate transporter, partial [Phenylobacterium sp.]|nr:chromate transporter [Phenylobacterium sp.]
VVGILAAALYDPVWTSAIVRPLDAVIAAAGFVALTALKAPPLAVVIGVVAANLAVTAFI